MITIADMRTRPQLTTFPRPDSVHHMNKILAATLVPVALAAGGLVTVQMNNETPTQPTATAHLAAPTTAAGYAAMFAAVPQREWAAADVALTVPLRDGRSIWLFGDTFSNQHGMVNSSAITQDGGRLHVSHAGAQLLPTGPGDVVYWIESAHAASDTQIIATVAPTHVAGLSSFKRATTTDRTALLSVSSAGDVTFSSWRANVQRPRLDTRWLTVADGAPYQQPGHLFYGKQTHNELRLSNGKGLVTICQNRATPARHADGRLDYRQYRPIFTS